MLAAQLIFEASIVVLRSTRFWAFVCIVSGVRSGVALVKAIEVCRDWRFIEFITEGD